eukprot:gene13864-16349_t
MTKPKKKQQSSVNAALSSTTSSTSAIFSNYHIGQSWKYSDLKHRNKLAANLSRTIPPFTVLKESQARMVVSRLDKLVEIDDKMDTAAVIWDTMLDTKQSNIDSYVHATTASILESRTETLAMTTIEQTSRTFKNLGNDLFQKKQYIDALLLYSEALRLFNIDASKDQQVLSSIYSNRCLCLVHLEKFEEGAIEATRGLECRSAEHLVHKLLYRRGICYFSLKKHNKARRDFQEAHSLVSKMDGSDIQSIESYLEKIAKMKLADTPDPETPPKSSYASLVDQRVTFRYESDTVGRQAEAKEPIASNTILFQERAYECCKGFLLLCSSESLIAIRLLAKKAKEAAKSTKPDTKYIPTASYTYNPPTTNNGQAMAKATKKTTNGVVTGSTTNGEQQVDHMITMTTTAGGEDAECEAMLHKSNVYTPNYDMIYSFDPHFNEHSNRKLASLIFEAFIIERFLAIYHKGLGIAKEDVSVPIILRHLCQQSTYIYSIPVFISQEDMCQHGLQRYIPVKIAYALFPMASLLNHSCDNNTLLQYNGTSIQIKSLKDIGKNEEVTACYGPHSFQLDLADRLKCLRDEYFFIFNMAKLGDSSDVDDKSTYEDYENRTFTCNKCGLELSSMETFLLTSLSLMSSTFYDNATKILMDGEPSKDVEVLLLKCLEIRMRIYQENSKKVGEVYDTLARYYIAEDNYKEAVQYAEKTVNNIYARLGHSHSTELAREWAKLANIYINAGEPAKAIGAINTSESLLVKWKTEPSDEEILSQLRNHKKVLEASKVIPGTNKFIGLLGLILNLTENRDLDKKTNDKMLAS